MKRVLLLVLFLFASVPVVYAEWTYYPIDSFSVANGALIIGDLESLLDVDGNNMTVRETGKFEIYFNVSNIPDSVQAINVMGYWQYDGNPAHIVEGQIFNFTSNSWVVMGQFSDTATYNWMNVSTSNWRNGDAVEDGTLYMRVIHTSPANPLHYMYFEYVQVKIIDDPPRLPSLSYALLAGVAVWFLMRRNKSGE